MKLVRPPRRYDSVEEFYAELPDADRRLSPELDFGVHWTEPHEVGWTWPRSRLTWVENTGELIVVRDARFVRRERHQLPVKVIAVIEGRAAIDEVLSGWAEHCHTEGLGWVYHQLETAVAAKEACAEALRR